MSALDKQKQDQQAGASLKVVLWYAATAPVFEAATEDVRDPGSIAMSTNPPAIHIH